ncbi:MAG: AbrB/MazE/SpoVT family DNA-binding domain-containing protein [Nanoarchaeota archaeon]|nr:AbrB/MazE/SpoVT family DNA-binding domain-containing protein [Nanoarchaeota archaeon]MBU1320790.1 AbrB/MazE/SpoVT family DNA-binding domain-containing protein [Nanoarchaeota archaeon]MBU1598295.1 AbrB/MazE/SpoVT family DNA-binding domain-containing protein [Nanoarchaeota archaeon]MBU2442259.1 AbrB/MazE/SpoVT family DNA-binding domain-containing protein [Nanoarchaeota archaeon]
MDVAITKMSSKGQIVIPKEMRKDIKEGDKILIIKTDDRMLLKKATEKDRQMQEDIEFSRRTEEAWKSYDRGEFITMDAKKFLKEMKKW